MALGGLPWGCGDRYTRKDAFWKGVFRCLILEFVCFGMVRAVTSFVQVIFIRVETLSLKPYPEEVFSH